MRVDTITDSRDDTRKSIGNRQRFIKRNRTIVKKVVKDAIQGKSIKDLSKGKDISVPTRGTIDEPTFGIDRDTGASKRVLPGNKDFSRGDKIKKPQQGSGSGTAGSDSGSGEDSFEFTLTREEFLDALFEDMALPNMTKKTLAKSKSFQRERAGFSTHGVTSNLDIVRTMQNRLGRCIALKRPKNADIKELEMRIKELNALIIRSKSEEKELKEAKIKLGNFKRKMSQVPFIYDTDVKYRRYDMVPKPITQAVMLCLMDVSGSMGEYEKDVAKRFFLLLYLFLQRQYDTIEIVFIRHTHEAVEVDEETFFYGKETGGTCVSSALEVADNIIATRYPIDEYNVYIAQASDGDNFDSDNPAVLDILGSGLVEKTQYFAYIEILRSGRAEMYRELMEAGQSAGISTGSSLWETYARVATWYKHFNMRPVAGPEMVYPVLHELFKKE